MSEAQEDSLDYEVLWPILDRVARGTVEVRHGEKREWYYDDGRQCLFATYLLDKLTEQDYIYWDPYIGEVGHRIARNRVHSRVLRHGERKAQAAGGHRRLARPPKMVYRYERNFDHTGRDQTGAK